jgi:hypothetical protein
MALSPWPPWDGKGPILDAKRGHLQLGKRPPPSCCLREDPAPADVRGLPVCQAEGSVGPRNSSHGRR